MELNKPSFELIKVERTVNAYRINDDEFVEEFNIDEIQFEDLVKIVTPPSDDPLLYDGYDLNVEQMKVINSLLKSKIVPQFDIYYYILVCGGIYK